MATRPTFFRPPSQGAKREQRREADHRRGSARERGYSREWDLAAKAHLLQHPACVYHQMAAWGGKPRIVAAQCVDHLVPHRGDREVFWNRRDWVSACHDCHNGPKQALEREGGFSFEAFIARVRAFQARG